MAQYYITPKSELLHELFTKDSRDQAFSQTWDHKVNLSLCNIFHIFYIQVAPNHSLYG